MLCHHNLDAYLHGYIDERGIAGEPKADLSRTSVAAPAPIRYATYPGQDLAVLSRRAGPDPMSPQDRRSQFRATGITAYLKNGGPLRKPQR